MCKFRTALGAAAGARWPPGVNSVARFRKRIVTMWRPPGECRDRRVFDAVRPFGTRRARRLHDMDVAAPRVSVVIPTYNRSHSVGTAVRSVIDQELAALECIVLDDGSVDDTPAVVSKIEDDRVRYIRRPHAGVAAARNAGVAEARANIIAFLDSDDIWRPEKLQREMDFLDRHPEVDAVF